MYLAWVYMYMCVIAFTDMYVHVYVCNGLYTNIFYMACVQIFLILSQVNNFFFIARLIGRAFL